MTNASHATFKRDQVEQAIALCSSILPRPEPERFAALKVELKRLLDQDRRQERETPRGSPVRRAFHSEPPPGRGFDVSYSGYEAFALLVALRLMRGGLTQARAVNFLIELRLPLGGALYEILGKSPVSLNPETDKAKRSRAIRDGYLVRSAEKMVHLVALAGDRAETFDIPSPYDRPISGNICRTLEELHERLVYASQSGHALIVVELANTAFQLDYHLTHTEARQRGRQ